MSSSDDRTPLPTAILELGHPTSWARLSPLAEADRPALEWVVGRLRGGDQSVLAHVIDELFPVVERWVRRLLGPRHDVLDVVQEALTEITVALHDFEGRSSIQTLAHRITTRTTARFYRKRPPAHEIEVDALAHSGPSPEDEASSRRDLARIYEHLDTLSEVRRTAFVLCCIEGMDPTEAAEIAQCSANTMRSRLFEARAELVRRLDRDAARADVRRPR